MHTETFAARDERRSGPARFALPLMALLLGACGLFDKEPTEAEMKQAVERNIQIDNPLNGMTVQISDLKKIACADAKDKPGYICDYTMTASMSFHSNEGTSGGQQHANAVNQLMMMLNGGRPMVETTAATSRFVKSDGQWMRLPD